MLKTYLFSLILLYISIQTVYGQPPEPQWITEKTKGVWVNANRIYGLPFSPRAERIKFDIECEKMCDIVLLTESHLENLKNGMRYETHFRMDSTIEAAYTFYDTKYIRETMWVIVRNMNNNQNFRANFELGNFMVPSFGPNIPLLTGILVPTLAIGAVVTVVIIIGLLVGLVIYLKKSRAASNSKPFDHGIEDEEAYGNVQDDE